MATKEQELSDTQALVGLAIIFLVLLVLASWYASSQSVNKSSTTTQSSAPASPDLKVVPGSGSPTTTGNPQQTANPSEGSTDSVQSGQPNLQPAPTATDSLKQQLGL